MGVFACILCIILLVVIAYMREEQHELDRRLNSLEEWQYWTVKDDDLK